MSSKQVQFLIWFVSGLVLCSMSRAELINRYELNGDAVDSVNSFDGNLIGNVSPARDRFDNPSGALSFDGNGDYIDVGNGELQNFTSNVSISAWIKPDNANSPGQTWPTIVGKYSGSGSAETFFFGFTENRARLFGEITTTGAGNQFDRDGSVRIVPDNRWSHVAMTVDAATHELKMYINGNAEFTGADYGDGLWLNESNNGIQIGGLIRSGVFTHGYRGVLDDIRIYDSAISDVDVKNLFCPEDLDTDGDAVMDSIDNCLQIANTPQRDTDLDGIGNACDADLSNDQIVNIVDLGILRSVFFSSNPDADLNGDGVVNVVDLGIFRTLFFLPPGPSCVAPFRR